MGGPSRRVTGGPVSPREREVLRLVADGRTNRQFADALVIAERTAEWYVAKLRARLGLETRGQLAVWALELGLEAADGADH